MLDLHFRNVDFLTHVCIGAFGTGSRYGGLGAHVSTLFVEHAMYLHCRE
jgi:hypothetical protein